MNLFDLPIEKHADTHSEWYTPARYVEAARLAMGSIDLDPASCELANQTVKATRFYTSDENALLQHWQAESIWLNPPYARDLSLPHDRRSRIAKWVEKLIGHYKAGDVRQAVLLCPARIDAKWFQFLWQYSICFPDHVIRFSVPSGSEKPSHRGWKTENHIFGSIFVYLGPHEHKFIEVFSQFGRVVPAIDTPKIELTNLELWSA